MKFKDDNYFSNLDDEIPKLVLIENVDNESDEMCKNFILDAANHNFAKT